MIEVKISSARANLKRHLDEVCESSEPLMISRPGAGSVVFVSLREYNRMLKVISKTREISAN